jgi:hypothetical protein
MGGPSLRRCGRQVRDEQAQQEQFDLESLAHFNRGAVSLPDHDKLLRELRCLERRVHRSGRDSVDHPTHGSDDYANAVVGCLNVSINALRKPRLRVGAIDVNGFVHWNDEESPRRVRVECYTPEQARELKEKGLW